MASNDQVLLCFLSREQIDSLPDHRGTTSWVFEPYLSLTDQDTLERLDRFTGELCTSWISARRKRKPSMKSQHRFRRCASVLLVNLLRAYCNKRPTNVGITRSKGRLNDEKRYRPDYMTAHLFLDVQNQLISQRYMLVAQKGYHSSSRQGGQTTRVALSEAAAERLAPSKVSLSDFHIEPAMETVQLKNSEKRLIGYRDTPDTTGFRSALQAINSLLVDTKITTSRPLTQCDRETETPSMRSFLHRVFNNGSFEQGGRFYGGWWQNIRKRSRRLILIDGQPTIEADYRGFNPAALLAKAGLDIPDDPYSKIEGIANDPKRREHAKTTFAALLNSKTGRIQEPMDFESGQHGITVEEFRESILQAFPMLRQPETAKGLELQRIESDIAESVMLHFIRLGHPILPVHDAFIVQAHLRNELVSVMKDTFRAKLGGSISVKVT